MVHKVLEITNKLSSKPIDETSGIIEKTSAKSWRFAYIKLMSVDYGKKTTAKYYDGKLFVFDITMLDELVKINDEGKKVSNGAIVYLIVAEKPLDTNALALLLGESVEWVKCYVSQVSPDRITWDEISNGPIEQLVNLNRC